MKGIAEALSDLCTACNVARVPIPLEIRFDKETLYEIYVDLMDDNTPGQLRNLMLESTFQGVKILEKRTW